MRQRRGVWGVLLPCLLLIVGTVSVTVSLTVV